MAERTAALKAALQEDLDVDLQQAARLPPLPGGGSGGWGCAMQAACCSSRPRVLSRRPPSLGACVCCLPMLPCSPPRGCSGQAAAGGGWAQATRLRAAPPCALHEQSRQRGPPAAAGTTGEQPAGARGRAAPREGSRRGAARAAGAAGAAGAGCTGSWQRARGCCCSWTARQCRAQHSSQSCQWRGCGGARRRCPSGACRRARVPRVFDKRPSW